VLINRCLLLAVVPGRRDVLAPASSVAETRSRYWAHSALSHTRTHLKYTHSVIVILSTTPNM